MGDTAYGSCRFYVEFNQETGAVFTELSGLNLETEVFEYHEGGRNDHPHRLPGRSKIGNLVLKRGLTRHNDFFKWCLDVTRGRIERKNLTVKLFDADGTLVASWDFVNAFPIKWSGPQFQADTTNIAIESLEIAHDGFKS